MAKIAQTRQRMLELEQQLAAVQVELDLAHERIAELEPAPEPAHERIAELESAPEPGPAGGGRRRR